MTNPKPKSLRDLVPTYRCATCGTRGFSATKCESNPVHDGAMEEWIYCPGPVRDVLAGRVIPVEVHQEGGAYYEAYADAHDAINLGGDPHPAALVLLDVPREGGESE